MNTKLYVGNLPPGTTAEDLRQLFATVGGVLSVEIVKDKRTGKNKGFAFVDMVSQGDAGKAVSEFNGYRLNQNSLKVTSAKNEPSRGRRNVGGYVEYKSYQESVLPPQKPNRRW
jgi:cold-inducible RNA-binding protein